MITNDLAVEAWLVKVENMIQKDKDFQFHWKLVVSKVCYELALEGEWDEFSQAASLFNEPQFKLSIK